MQQDKALVVQAGEGAQFDVAGVRFVYKARSEDTGGRYAFTEGLVPAGRGAPLHVHHREDEAFYVLAGSFEIECGSETFSAGPGTFALLPKNVPHRFRNVSSEPGKLLCVQSPAGVEAFFAHLAALAADGAPDRERMTALMRAYDIEFFDAP